MSTNNPEIRDLTLDEIDIVSGGADKGKTYDLGFGISLFTDGTCWTVNRYSDGGNTLTSVTHCGK